MNYSLHEEGKRRAVIKYVENMYTKQFNIWSNEGKYHKICPDEDFVKMFQKLAEKGKLYGYWLITIRPKDRIFSDMHDVRTVAHQLISTAQRIRSYKNFIGDMYYAVEQASTLEEEKYHGLHLHIVAVDIGRNKSQILSRVKNAYKKCCTEEISDNGFDAKPCTVDKIKYVQGEKEKSKQPLVECDRVMRQQIGIEDFYHEKRY